MAGWDDVRRVALSLPGTEERTSRDTLGWCVRDRLFVWERPLRKGDLAALGDDAPSGPILGVRTAGLEEKEAMLLEDPELFFTTPHFNGYPAVLARLEQMGGDALEVVAEDAWLAVAPRRLAAEYLQRRAGRG